MSKVRVYDEPGNVIETHEHRATSKSSDAFFRFWVAKLGVGVVNAHASFTPCVGVLLPGCPNSGLR